MKLRILLLFVFISLFALVLPAQAQDVDVDEIYFARDITFGDSSPIHPDEVFPTALTTVYAVVDGTGLEPGDEIDVIWYHEGDEIENYFWENNTDSDVFRVWSSHTNEDGIEEGDWTVEVLYDGDVIGEAEFEVTDDEFVYPIRFAEDCGRDTGALINENTEFEDITYIYAYVEFANFDDGIVHTAWVIEGEVYDFDIEAEADGEGWRCFYLENSGDPIPEGEYGLIISNEDGDELRESEEFEVSE